MLISDDADPDILIDRLAAPLLPADRAAFRAAAEDALTRVPCLGEGAIYRAVAALQRIYFHPPPDTRATSTGARHYRPSKLAMLPPVGADDARGVARRLAQCGRT